MNLSHLQTLMHGRKPPSDSAEDSLRRAVRINTIVVTILALSVSYTLVTVYRFYQVLGGSSKVIQGTSALIQILCLITVLLIRRNLKLARHFHRMHLQQLAQLDTILAARATQFQMTQMPQTGTTSDNGDSHAH